MWVPRLGRVSGTSASSCSSCGRVRAAQTPPGGGGGPRQRVVHVQADADEPVGLRAVERRDYELQRAHEVRGELDEQLALEQRLAHEPEVEVLQVAQAAVDQLARPAARAEREVLALDERDAVAARGGVERHPGARDAAADHDDVEAIGLECGESLFARDHARYVTYSPDGCRAGGCLSWHGCPRYTSPRMRSSSGTSTASRPSCVRSTSGVRQ